MSNKGTCLRLFELLRDFRSARAGNVAITFGLLVVPLIGAVGAAVDYSRANWVKTSMQTTVDSVALMISKEASTVARRSIADGRTKLLHSDVLEAGREEHQRQRHIHKHQRLKFGRQRHRHAAHHIRELARLQPVRSRRIVHGQVGHDTAAGGVGARQYWINGAERQDHRAQDRNQ